MVFTPLPRSILALFYDHRGLGKVSWALVFGLTCPVNREVFGFPIEDSSHVHVKPRVDRSKPS